MGELIDQWVIDKVLAIVSIVDLIGGWVPLHRSPEHWIGACPACGGTIWVTQDPGFYQCRECWEAGDAVQWLQRREPTLSFREAIVRLAFFSGCSGLVSQVQPRPGD